VSEVVCAHRTEHTVGRDAGSAWRKRNGSSRTSDRYLSSYKTLKCRPKYFIGFYCVLKLRKKN